MASWLDFLLSGKGAKVQTRTGGFSAAMDELMKAIPNDNFAGNLLFILEVASAELEQSANPRIGTTIHHSCLFTN